MDSDRRHLSHLIHYYFTLGLQHQEILFFLSKYDKIDISLRTLKRYLIRLRLYRRKEYSNMNTVASFIEQQILKYGQLHGYKWMHLKCIQSGLTVKQDTIRLLLQILDPLGVSLRSKNRLRRRRYSNKGPNYLWHVDAYDKLKPYGISINGCIDGLSRNIMWLQASSTTSNPKVIAGFYIKTVQTLKGCPRTVRTDMGTENGYLEDMQIYFRQYSNLDHNAMPPFLYGTSQTNQRIESWWCILRKHHAQFWMNLFLSLRDDGLFTGSFLDKSLIQYCFLNIIQRELDEVVQEWNMHRIRRVRNAISPYGRPSMMYCFPELYNGENYLIKIDEDIILSCEEECVFLETPCDRDVYDFCDILLSDLHLNKAFDPFDAVNLYVNLRREIMHLL